MTEYGELREKIAIRLAEEKTLDDFIPSEIADDILSIIAERCWLKPSEGALIDCLRYLKGEGLSTPLAKQYTAELYANPYKLGKELYTWLQQTKEIKKEAKD